MSAHIINNIVIDTNTSLNGDFFIDWEPCTVISIILFFALAGVTTGYVLMDSLIPKKTKTVETDESKRIREYEKGYLDELVALDDIELSKEVLSALREVKVEDETPFGKVIMTYNSDTESYWYYSDSKSVPYKTLDAVARQFAVTHSCKCVCVNYKEEWEKAKAAAKAAETKGAETKAAETKPNKQRDVFAKLKKYNDIDKQANAESNATVNGKRKDSIKRRKYKLVNEKANRFTHKGRLTEYVVHNKSEPEIKPKPNPKAKITFADFKANANANANANASVVEKSKKEN